MVKREGLLMLLIKAGFTMLQTVFYGKVENIWLCMWQVVTLQRNSKRLRTGMNL